MSRYFVMRSSADWEAVQVGTASAEWDGEVFYE